MAPLFCCCTLTWLRAGLFGQPDGEFINVDEEDMEMLEESLTLAKLTEKDPGPEDLRSTLMPHQQVDRPLTCAFPSPQFPCLPTCEVVGYYVSRGS